MGELTVIGYCGADLGAEALAALASATLVVGGARHLRAAAVPVPDGARTIQVGALEPALDELSRHEGNAVVVASGDPGFFGIVRRLRARGIEVDRVIPAVSSVAAAFAAVRIDWDDAAVVSAHGSSIDPHRSVRRAVNACLAHPKVAVLTGPASGPRELARGLLAAGLKPNDRVLWAAERLGTDEERVRSFSLDEAVAAQVADPNVVLCLAQAQVQARASAGWLAGVRTGGVTAAPVSPLPLPDEAFEHRDGQITKQETRSLAVTRLAPRFGELLWDLGSGSGSVGIECARRGAAVIAVERDTESCERIRRNAAQHGETGLYICAGDAADLASRLPDPDAVFIGGGGMDVLRTVLDRRPPRIVATFAALERAAAVLPLLAGHGYAAEGVLNQASRFAALPDGTHRLAPQNPVFLIWGELL
ncbi:MAG TPA: precorrin-6y C5,15-methyltransferase (decarboxylating) subunit CbiE [Actinospica sp.]|nr:precorrin-6y C5,15-methyltransferase (decarboxylating) subunit CbiE [Actinospica sp.]